MQKSVSVYKYIVCNWSCISVLMLQCRGCSHQPPTSPPLPSRYCWLFYINPNFYGFSASAFILLEEFQPQCDKSELECYVQSGEYILRQFSFDNINPFLNLVVSCVYVRTCRYRLDFSIDRTCLCRTCVTCVS